MQVKYSDKMRIQLYTATVVRLCSASSKVFPHSSLSKITCAQGQGKESAPLSKVYANFKTIKLLKTFPILIRQFPPPPTHPSTLQPETNCPLCTPLAPQKHYLLDNTKSMVSNINGK